MDCPLWGAAGLALAPLLFSIYMKPLGEIIGHHGTRYLQYTDDAQLYISIMVDPSDAEVALMVLEFVGVWMGDNGLQLNPGKRE